MHLFPRGFVAHAEASGAPQERFHEAVAFFDLPPHGGVAGAAAGNALAERLLDEAREGQPEAGSLCLCFPVGGVVDAQGRPHAPNPTDKCHICQMTGWPGLRQGSGG